jgi:hypothetical protein
MIQFEINSDIEWVQPVKLNILTTISMNNKIKLISIRIFINVSY